MWCEPCQKVRGPNQRTKELISQVHGSKGHQTSGQAVSSITQTATSTRLRWRISRWSWLRLTTNQSLLFRLSVILWWTWSDNSSSSMASQSDWESEEAHLALDDWDNSVCIFCIHVNSVHLTMTAIITMTKFLIKNLVIFKKNLWVMAGKEAPAWICHFLLWPVKMTGKH